MSQHRLMLSACSNDGMARTRQPDPLKHTRQEALRAFCKKKGWKTEGGDWLLQDIAEFFKKPRNKMSDLLYGRGSFGARIARDLEEASGGELHRYALDGDEGMGGRGLRWPFSVDLGNKVGLLDDEDLWHAENALRAHLKMDPLPRPSLLGGDESLAA